MELPISMNGWVLPVGNSGPRRQVVAAARECGLNVGRQCVRGLTQRVVHLRQAVERGPDPVEKHLGVGRCVDRYAEIGYDVFVSIDKVDPVPEGSRFASNACDRYLRYWNPTGREASLVVKLHALENRRRKLGRVVRLDVVSIAKKEQIGVGSSFFVSRGRVVPRPPGSGGFNVTHLSDELVLFVQDGVRAIWEGAAIAGPNKERPNCVISGIRSPAGSHSVRWRRSAPCQGFRLQPKEMAFCYEHLTNIAAGGR